MLEQEKLKSTKHLIEILASAIGLFTGLSFGLGFLIWNIYLQGLGFYPEGLFQVRYIFTGTLFIVSTLFIFAVLTPLWKYFKKIGFEGQKDVRQLSVRVLLSIIWLFLFSFVFFPFIPIELGGALPRSVSIIANADEIDFLKQFGIEKGKGSLVQTANLCVVYEDEDSIITVLNDRILSLRKENLKGFVSLPTLEIAMFKFQCSIVILEKLTHLDRLSQ